VRTNFKGEVCNKYYYSFCILIVVQLLNHMIISCCLVLTVVVLIRVLIILQKYENYVINVSLAMHVYRNTVHLFRKQWRELMQLLKNIRLTCTDGHENHLMTHRFEWGVGLASLKQIRKNLEGVCV